MSENDHTSGKAVPAARGPILYGVLGALTLAGIVALAWMNRDFTITVDRDTGASLSVQSGIGFEEVLEKSLEAHPERVAAALAQSGFYNIESASLVDALRRIDPSRPESEAVVRGMRTLFREQRGPFRMPDALLQADGRLIAALESLETQLRESNQASELIVELWRRSLDYEGIFRARLFDAEVVRVPELLPYESDNIRIYACSGSDFVNTDVMLLTDRQTSIVAKVMNNPFHTCDGAHQRFSELFERRAARFGLNAQGFELLFGEPEPSDEPHMVQFQFLANGKADLIRMTTEH